MLTRSMPILLMFASPIQASEYPADPGTVLSERAISMIRGLDAAGIHALLTEEAKATIDLSRVEAALDGVRPLGLLQDTLLAVSEPFAPQCVRQVRAASFAQGEAQIITVACPVGGGWGLAGFHVYPDLPALLNNIFREVLPAKLGVGFLHHDCDLEPQPADGEMFMCTATASTGATYEFQLQRRAGNEFEIVRYRGISDPMPSPSRSELTGAAYKFIELYSEGRFDEVYAEASGPLRRVMSSDRLTAMLKLLQSEGPIEKSVVTSASVDEKQLPVVTMAVSWVSGRESEWVLNFMPERDEWRLSGIALNPPEGFEAEPKLLLAAIRQTAQQLTHDPETQIRCPMVELGDDTLVSCEGVAYGREVSFEVAWSGENPLQYEVFIEDISTLVRARLERFEPLLGWSVDDLDCREANSDIFHCEAASEDGDRQLTIYRKDDALAVIGVEKR